MIRPTHLPLLVLLALAAPTAGRAQQPPARTATAAATSPAQTAAWACQGGKCNYRKTQGAWGDCFTSWSPTHGGWLPTRYCR